MKFTVAALAFAGLVAANKNATEGALTTSTVWQTTERTITSCAPTVTNCPAESHSVYVVTDTVALYTTICPVAQASGSPAPAPPAPAPGAPAPAPGTGAPGAPAPAPATSAAAVPAPAPPAATNKPVAPGAQPTYAAGSPATTAAAASGTVGTVGAPGKTATSAPIATGAAGRAGPAFGGLAVAAAVAMML